MSGGPVKFSQTVEFPAGSVAIHEDGAVTFHFRNMEYVYRPGRDSEDGMKITLDKDTADAVKRLFRREAGY